MRKTISLLILALCITASLATAAVLYTLNLQASVTIVPEEEAGSAAEVGASGSNEIKIGDSVKYGSKEQLLLTFTGYSLLPRLDGREATEGRVFCLVNMTVKNISDQDLKRGDLSLPINPNAYFGTRGVVLVAGEYKFKEYGTGRMILEIGIGETIETYLVLEILTGIEPKELRIGDDIILFL